jgi:ABC-2 type transport system permease protein
MRFDLPDAYWKKDVALFFSRRFALILKMLYPMAIIVPVAASGIPAKYAAAVIGIVAVMAGTFGAGESLTIDLNDGILVRVALTPLSPYRIVFEILAVNAVLDLVQLLPALLIVYLLHPLSPLWMLAATLAIFATLVTANCIGVFIANFTSSPADVLLYATAILFPLIYLSGFFRNQHPTGILQTLRGLVPFAYADDALKRVFGLATGTTPLEILVYPTIICAVLAGAVCLTAPRLLSQRL